MYATAYNPAAGPVVVDLEGRTIGGHSWGTVETTDDRAADLIEQGGLLVVERPDGDLNPEAAAAFDRTDLIAERETALDRLSKAKLVRLATDGQLPGFDPDDPPHKPDLVARLARRTSIDVPSRSSGDDDTDSPEPEEA